MATTTITVEFDRSGLQVRSKYGPMVPLPGYVYLTVPEADYMAIHRKCERQGVIRTLGVYAANGFFAEEEVKEDWNI